MGREEMAKVTARPPPGNAFTLGEFYPCLPDSSGDSQREGWGATLTLPSPSSGATF